jgi:hypothetical protein
LKAELEEQQRVERAELHLLEQKTRKAREEAEMEAKKLADLKQRNV